MNVRFKCTRCGTVSPHQKPCFYCGCKEKAKIVVPRPRPKPSGGTLLSIGLK